MTDKVKNTKIFPIRPLSASDADPLRESIAHWEEMRDYGTGKPTASQCPLCIFFGNACDECPIRMYTGYDSCRSTPYRLAETAWCELGTNSQAFKEAATKEIEFLQTVLSWVEASLND